MTVPSYGYDLTGSGVLPASAAAPGKALPIARDLELDPLTHDLVVTAGDMRLVKDGPAIRQEVDITFKLFLGEWFLDTTRGIPYLEQILVKAPNLAAIRTVLTDAALGVVGIKSMTKMDLDYDASARTLSVEWSATTDLGELIESGVTL